MMFFNNILGVQYLEYTDLLITEQELTKEWLAKA